MEIRVRTTMFEELLGSQPGDPEVHERFIASKAPDAKTREEEVAEIGVDAEIEKGKTVFYRKDGVPGLLGYQIQGFFKESIGILNRLASDPASQEEFFGVRLKKLSAHKKRIDGECKILSLNGRRGDKFLPLILPEGGEITSLQRPLRGQTAQGERISLANSECAPSGTVVEFKVICSTEIEPYIRACLNYGETKGFGQWRNSGKGSFVWEELDADGNVIGGNR